MYFYGFYALKEKEYSKKVLIELSLKTAKAVKADERFGNVIPSASKSHDQDLRAFFKTLAEIKSAVVLNEYDHLVQFNSILKHQCVNRLEILAQMMIDNVEKICEANVIKCDSAASFFEAFLSQSKWTKSSKG